MTHIHHWTILCGPFPVRLDWNHVAVDEVQQAWMQTGCPGCGKKRHGNIEIVGRLTAVKVQRWLRELNDAQIKRAADRLAIPAGRMSAETARPNGAVVCFAQQQARKDMMTAKEYIDRRVAEGYKSKATVLGVKESEEEKPRTVFWHVHEDEQLPNRVVVTFDDAWDSNDTNGVRLAEELQSNK